MVDILMATYNGGKYIRDQIDSILRQTYKEFRLLIRDDGSTDETLDIIYEYIEKYPQKINLITDNEKCGSPASNFMQLIRYATADYVMYSDQDDLWLPDKIKVTLGRMQKEENKVGKNVPILVFAKYRVVNSELEDYNYNINEISNFKDGNFRLNNLLVESYILGCLMMLNRSLYRLIGDYSPFIRMHDVWTALVAGAMGKIYYEPQIVMLYRQHNNNCVGTINIKSMKYRLSRLGDKRTRNIQYQYMKQAELLIERYEDILDEYSKNTILKFINIFHEKSKVKRVICLLKGQYLKSDFFQVIGQIWYI